MAGSVTDRGADKLSGRTLGDFVVRELIGQGGFGAVYRAEQPLLEREAVIKVMADQASTSDSSVARFLREARLASQLDHPYAAHIYAFGAEDDGLRWIAMELVRGSTLDGILSAQGPMPIERFAPLFAKLCEVVHTAHDQGIVHRDLKPENVMVLSRAGRYLPKLLDLGIAKAAGGDEPPAAQLAAGKGGEIAVTGAGGMVGTPRYMAPELWFKPGSAGSSVDQYALGALAFEALTGEPAFPGTTLEEVAMAHAKKPPRELPDSFPRLLSDALVKAMGKRPKDRYSGVLEFATAFHEATGLELKRIEVPEIEADLLARVLDSYPRPIVDAVAAYTATYNAHQARDAVRSIMRALSRYIGIMAIACRSRLDPASRGHTPRADELLIELRRGGLADAAWIELAVELCRPFARRPETFPLPDMVLWLFPARNPDVVVDPFDELSQQSGVLDSIGGSDEAALEAVTSAIPALQEVLRSASFIGDYKLVVPRASRAVSWMGRSQRTPVTVACDPNLPERAVLLGIDDNPVLSMWPLVQVAEPSPGEPEEIFLLEGPGRHAARLLSHPVGFETSDDDVWQWFSDQVLRVGDDDEAEADIERPPYLGMSAFGADDADYFYGRERESEAVANRLRGQSFIAVVGPSGAGKSSFLHAGVVPAMRGTTALSVRPGASPIANIEARLLRAGFAAEGLKARLTDSTDALGQILRDGDEPVLLIIDQFEEMFTMCRDDDERDLAIAGLCTAARNVDDPVRVALTLRDDFLMTAEKNAQLRPRLARGLQLLGTPSAADLRRILIEPARRVGYVYEDEYVVGEMVEAVAELPGALPLLSFTASKLWGLRDRHFKQLPTKAYRSLGGVVGALAQHAEDTLEDMAAGERKLVRQAFRHLVTAEGTRASLTREELREVLGGPEQAASVIEKLVTARILVASESERGDVLIEVVHEALLSAWPRLVEWRREDAEGARLRDQLRAAARQWDERDRPAGLLWRGDALAELSIWRGRFPGELTATEAAFADSSSRDALRGRRIRQALMLVAFVALAVGLVILYRANDRAQRSAEDSQERLKALMQEQGRQAHIDARPLESILYLNRAYQLGVDGPALRYMLARAIRSRNAELRTIRGVEKAGFWGVAYSPDGMLLAVANAAGVILVFDAKTGERIAEMKEQGVVSEVAFSADSKKLLSRWPQGVVSLWNARTGERLTEIKMKASFINASELSADGKRIVVCDSSGAYLFDAITGEKLWEERSKAPIWRVLFSPSGDRFASVGEEALLRIYRSDGTALAVGKGHKAGISNLDFSADGSLIATAGDDRTLAIWNAHDGSLLRKIPQRSDGVVSVRFNPKGDKVTSGGQFRTGAVYSATDGREVATLRGHTGFVNLGEFVTRGDELVTVSADGTLRLWDVGRGAQLATFAGHTAFIWGVSIQPDGKQMTSTSWDGTARVWDLSARQVVSFFGKAAKFATVDPAGERVLVVRPGAVQVHSAVTGDKVFGVVGLPENTSSAAFDGDGVVVAVGSELRRYDATGTKSATAKVAADITNTVPGPNGKYFAVVDMAHTVYLLEATTLKTVAKRTFDEGPPRQVAFAPRGDQLAVFGLHVKTLSVPAFEPLASIVEKDIEDGAPFVVLSYSPDGSLLYGARSFNTEANIYSASGERVRTHEMLAPVMDARISSDGKHMAAVSMDGTAEIVNLEDGRVVGRLIGHAGALNSVQFSPDGEFLLTSSSDGTAALWDGESYRQLDSFAVHSGQVQKAWFAGGVRRVVTWSTDGMSVLDISRDIPTRPDLAKYVACRIDNELGPSGIQPRAVRPQDCAEQ